MKRLMEKPLPFDNIVSQDDIDVNTNILGEGNKNVLTIKKSVVDYEQRATIAQAGSVTNRQSQYTA
ncbi:MAG: hypothetical protein PHE51_03865 [Eubacteriales bacterium]|nr:hypothetical protein [Eubacteriales bacterium]